jgi:hypothetical protein
VTGTTDGAFPGQTSAGGVDAFLSAHDAAGSILWTDQFGTTGDEWASAVAVKRNIYVVGTTGGTLPGQTSAGGRDAFVRMYDSLGSVLWTSQFGTIGEDGAAGVAVAKHVFVVGFAGWHYGLLPGNHGTLSGQGNAFVRMYTLKGQTFWDSQFGSAGGEGANSVAIRQDGYVVAGVTDGTLPLTASVGGRDAFVMLVRP